MDEPVPERLGDHVLERRLGSGGMGVVYLARTAAGRRVAVKVIRREYAEDPGFRARFEREVAAARRVSGAFTAPLVDADPTGDPPWLATLYVPGGSLADRVAREGALPAREAARVGAQLAEALADIHRCGLVHRDLKPGNVLLADDGVRVIDFGISRALADPQRLTEAGAVLGSPPFMAPEQLTGGAEVTAAADVFALGAVVAFAATGRSPFEPGDRPRGGDDPLAVAYRVVHEEPDLTGVPPALRDLVALCLAKDPESRPPVAALVRMAAWAGTRAQAADVRSSPVWRAADADRPDGGDDTGTAAPGRPGRRRRRVAAAALAVALAAGGAGLGLWLAGDDGGAAGGPGTDDRPVATGGAEPAVRPWEVDWQDWGVADAAIAGVRCAHLAPDLLCTADDGLAVLFGPDGTERWRHRAPRAAATPPHALAPAGASVVFAPSEQGVAALDRHDGTPRWEIDAPELLGSLAATDGALVLQNGDSTLRFYELDAPRPRGTWEAPGRYITHTLAHGDRVLAQSRENGLGARPELTLLDGRGREVWPAAAVPPDDAPGPLDPVGMDDDAAYFEEWDPDLPVVTAVLRLDLGDRTWTRTPLPRPAEPRTVVGGDGLLYASDSGGLITAVDPAAGDVLWSEETGIGRASAPAAAGGRLYLTDGDGRLYEVSGHTGRVLRAGEPHPGTLGPGSDAWAPAPAVTEGGDDGVAYVVTLGNTLYATPLSALAEPDGRG